MLTENAIVDAVAEYLEGKNYQIVQKLTTAQRGIDLIAVQSKTGKRLLIEAKGGTSSRESTNRFGKPFNGGQAKSHVSMAFFYAAMLLQRHSSEGASVGLAFPDDKFHRKLVKGIALALDRLSIRVYFVSELRKVSDFKIEENTIPNS